MITVRMDDVLCTRRRRTRTLLRGATSPSSVYLTAPRASTCAPQRELQMRVEQGGCSLLDNLERETHSVRVFRSRRLVEHGVLAERRQESTSSSASVLQCVVTMIRKAVAGLERRAGLKCSATLGRVKFTKSTLVATAVSATFTNDCCPSAR
jgi:hypothetical protein